MGKTLKARFVLQDQYTRIIERMQRATERYSRSVGDSSEKTDGLGKSSQNATPKITKMVQAFMGLRIVQTIINGIVKGMQEMDTYSNTLARLKLINDNKQTPTELNDKIFAAANRSRGSYGSMAESVARIGMLAGGKFSSNDELIGFTELVQKSFKLGGAGTEEQKSAMLQLSQAMASGRLQGDEYVSIIENAPLIADAIAKYTGVGREGLKELSSDGAITADIIKNAVFSMADDINEQFKTIPKTWGDYMNRIQNGALRAFGKVFDSISMIINTEKFEKFVNNIVRGIYFIANITSAGINFLVPIMSGFFDFIGNMVSWIVSFVASNWNIISSILYAGIIVRIALLVMWLWSAGTALWAMVPAVLANAAAFASANLPLILMIGLIALIIYALNKMGVTTSEMVGFVTGLFFILGAYIGNQFIKAHNVVADFANFFHNVFKDLVRSVAILFLDLATTVLGYIRTLAKGIETVLNKIPGVEISITGSIDKLMGVLDGASGKLKDQMGWEELVKKKEYFDLVDAGSKGYKSGKNFADDIGSKFEKLFDGSLFKGVNNPYDKMDLSSMLGKNVPKVQKIEGKGKNGAVKVEMSDEDIKYLRDSAERDFVAKIQHKTLAPNINVKFTGPISKETDTDKMYKRITKILKEEIAMAGEV